MKYSKLTTILLILGSLVLPATLIQASPKDKKQKGKPGHAEKGKKGKPDHPGNKQKEKGGKGHQHKHPENPKAPDKHFKNGRLIEKERNVIAGFFNNYREEKYGLPPGLAKNLRRGKALPPGWQKKLQPDSIVNEAWLDRFTPVSYQYFPDLTGQKDTRLYLYDDRLIRVYEPERRVLDVIALQAVRALLK